MCAINGFNFKDEDLIKRMIDSTRHRGPDQDGLFCNESISLGSAWAARGLRSMIFRSAVVSPSGMKIKQSA